MGISGVSASGYYQGQTTPSQNMPSQTAPVQDEENALVGVLEEEDRKTLTEMMKEAREQADWQAPMTGMRRRRNSGRRCSRFPRTAAATATPP